MDDQRRMPIQRLRGMVQFPISNGSSSDHQRAIGNGIGHTVELLGVLEHRGAADGRARLAEREAKGIHDPEMSRAEIAHSTRRRTDIQRVAWTYHHDYEVGEIEQRQALILRYGPVQPSVRGWRPERVLCVRRRLASQLCWPGASHPAPRSLPRSS